MATEHQKFTVRSIILVLYSFLWNHLIALCEERKKIILFYYFTEFCLVLHMKSTQGFIALIKYHPQVIRHCLGCFVIFLSLTDMVPNHFDCMAENSVLTLHNISFRGHKSFPCVALFTRKLSNLVKLLILKLWSYCTVTAHGIITHLYWCFCGIL